MTRHGRRPSLIGRPTRRYHRAHGVRYFHACYSVGDVTLRGVNRRKRGAGNTLAALRLPTVVRVRGPRLATFHSNGSGRPASPRQKWLSDFDYSVNPNVQPAVVNNFATCD